MRTVAASALFAVLAAAVVQAQDQTTAKSLSWKERAKLDYQRRYEKYILHKQGVSVPGDEENAIAGGGGSEINAITDAGAAPVFRLPLSTTTFRPPPPPPTTTFRPRPPPTTRAPPPPPTTRAPPPTTRAPPPPPTTRAPPPPTTTRAPPPPPTTRAPPPPPPRRVAQTTEAPAPAVQAVGVRGAFPGGEETASAAGAQQEQGQQDPQGQQGQQGQRGQQGQQSTVTSTFQSRPGAFPSAPNGGSFASSSATAFNSGGVAGGSSGSSAGTFNAGGVATGTFTFTNGGSGSASASTTGAVSKSPVALLGKVVQGIVRPITSILPAPLGPKGSNPGLVGGLVSGIFEELDGGLRAIYPGTLWCGAGNVARSEDEVGVFRSTDKCCRQHDNCPDSIAAGATRHGLRNTGTFTRSHCDCDEAFYNCLKADRKSIVSVKVGTTYFNLLRPRCFRAVGPASSSCALSSPAAANCTATYRWFNNRRF